MRRLSARDRFSRNTGGVKTMERRGVENRETRETIRHAVTNERARGNAGCGRSGGEALGNLVERTTETTKRER